MHHHQSKHSAGFSVVEVLIVVVVIAALALGGWYLMQKNKDDKASSENNSTSQNDAKNDDNGEKYLEVKNHGFKIKLSEPILDAYVVEDETGSAAFGVRSLDSYTDCKAELATNEVNGTTYYKGVSILSMDIYDAERIEHGGDPEASAFKQYGDVVRIGNSYFRAEAYEGCKSNDTVVQAKIKAAQDAFNTAVKDAVSL